MLTLPVAVVLAGLITQDRPVETFHALSLSGGLEVTVKRGGKAQLKLTGEPEDVAKVESAVKSGRLTVGPKSGTWRMGRVTAEITVPSFEALEASGGVEVKGDGLQAASCAIDVSGGVEVSLDRNACEAMKVEASGGAEVTLAGAVKRLDLDLSGGVDLDLAKLNASAAKIRASGGVTGGVAVADSLDADLSGGVSLKVKGHPKVARAETSGSAALSYE
jgi:hypothetical protein